MKSENNILRILTAEEAAESDRAYESFDKIVGKFESHAKWLARITR